MRVSSVNGSNSVYSDKKNSGMNFGHTFRVSICTKDAEGITSYVSPAKNTKLYKKLNKRVVGFLNEDFISNLRSIIGVPRQFVRSKTINEVQLQKDLVQNLKNIDSDYSQANFVRSVYSKGALAHIATGADAPIIEEFMGANEIGVAKKLAKVAGLPVWETDARNVVAEYQKMAHDYVSNPVQFLRSENDHEIMLRVNFNEIKGKRGGKSKYEMSDFNFQELKTKPLAPLSAKDESVKKERSLNWLVQRYIKHSFDKIYEKSKSKLTPQQVLDVRTKFAAFISKKINITHDLPIE